jgi:hypothetical protein
MSALLYWMCVEGPASEPASGQLPSACAGVHLRTLGCASGDDCQGSFWKLVGNLLV